VYILFVDDNTVTLYRKRNEMNITPFDLIDAPLSGVNLIESGAGTGKTYTITGLFLRLILETCLTIDQILVVTFTKAATEELKDRIRQKLLEAKTGFSTGVCSDPMVQSLLAKQADRIEAHQRISDALTDFDTAAIFTIHGFCQRILFENAFETGSLFNTEITMETTRIFQGVADDFWRRHICGLPPEVIGYARNEGGLSDPAFFLKMMERYERTDINVVPRLKKPKFTHLESYRCILSRIRTEWPPFRDLCPVLLNDPGLNATIYGSLKNGSRGLKNLALQEAMDRLTQPVAPGFPLFKGFEKLTSTKLKRSAKKGHLPPEHPFFNLCTELSAENAALTEEIERYLLYLKTRMFHFAGIELGKRKRQENVNFFYDLLVTVNQALEQPHGNRLSHAIRNRFKAALVDEFQDTDALQYNIFSKLFTQKDTILFMIGDPKQAIYGFRGADIFSYLKAVRNTEKRYTLTTNWRSDPELITAVNTIFSNRKTPFLFPDISFTDAVPGRPSKQKVREGAPPLELWYLDLNSEKPIVKSEATRLISEYVADEILNLVRKQTPGMQPGDIAVLVRTNRQALGIKSLLAARSVPAVLYQSGNIFDTHEAGEIEQILSSVSEPGNDRRFRSAMTTDIMGVSGETIEAADTGDSSLDSRRINFRKYLEVWKMDGFIRMFRLFLTREKIRERVLSFPDGERRLTNILHIEELLQTVSAKRRFGISGLVKWLSEQRDPKTPRQEAHQLRLESDAHAVKIATIHKSKGLEYDTVFCPFAWNGSDISAPDIVFHDPGGKEQVCLDLGSDNFEAHKKLAQDELLSENIRLLYVALTRARKKCYLVWGRIRTAETSALAYLFHYDSGCAPSDIVSELKCQMRLIRPDQLLADIHGVVAAANGSISFLYLPENRSPLAFDPQPVSVRLFGRHFSKGIGSPWRISSYSSLIYQHGTETESPDRDAHVYHHPAVDHTAPVPDMFSFPRGIRAGLFFHEILENISFSNPPAGLTAVVRTKLGEYGFDAVWAQTVIEMIRHVLSVPLPAGDGPFSLMDVNSEQRVNEMEFYFPLNAVSPEKLKNIFTIRQDLGIPRDFPDRLERLIYSPTAGFMKGFVDLIIEHRGKFYIIDWKSNYLGFRIEDYHQKALASVMVDGYYILQYYLYTLAVDRFLSVRVPGYRYETHFGGVFYLFLRGIDQKRGSSFGIYGDLPAKEVIDGLRSALIPESIK
jgi:exodeoxyribonuclease V beta subunit